MKKVSDTTIFALLFVLAVGLFLLVYFVPLKNVNDEISSLENSNTALRAEVSELQVYHDNRSQYETDTETLKKEIVNVITAYPSAYREEDFIMEAIAMEKASNDEMQYTSLAFNTPETLAVIDEGTMQAAEIDGYTNRVEFMRQVVNYNNDITYDALKNALAEAFASGYKANVESITYTKDEEGVVLNGTISLGYYYVNGNGRDYVAPTITPYEAGTNNIFIGGKPIVNEEETTEE